jgi:catechol 2,3-dioxygenase-like lactoylglutathione lyase family enzyme
VGIGVSDAGVAFEWYKKYFGFGTVVFEDVAKASLMHRYTGGVVHERYAVLAMNMQGGGGLEIWQYTNRAPKPPMHKPQLGDPGIFAIKIKCKNAGAVYRWYSAEGVDVINSVCTNPSGQKQFFVRDPFDNIFQIVEDDYWFQKGSALTGGVCGAIIGVSGMQKALPFFQKILNYKEVNYKGNEVFEDLKVLPGNMKAHRVILKNTPSYCGAFSKLLGPTTIELIEAEEKRTKIFDSRWWGDLGFIHVCYDVCGMQLHADICKKEGHSLTVNSGDSFEMGEAAGQFAYNEDPDGTLIEYVETHKVPILKKLGLYLNLRKRKTAKALPHWVVKCMGFSKTSLTLQPGKLRSIEKKETTVKEISRIEAR